MLDLHKKKTALPPSAGREKMEREIAVTGEKIDAIVSGLYGITEGEIYFTIYTVFTKTFLT